MGKHMRMATKREIEYGSFRYDSYDDLQKMISSIDMLMYGLKEEVFEWKNFESDEAIELSVEPFELLEETNLEIIAKLIAKKFLHPEDFEEAEGYDKALEFLRSLHKELKGTQMENADYIRIDFFN